MPSIVHKARQLIFADDPASSLRKVSKKDWSKSLTKRELIQLESQIGQAIFGPLPVNVLRREFFNLDPTTWIWHEEIRNPDDTTQELTTKYEIQSKGILKVQPGYKYTYLEGAELDNFILATREYYERISRELYKRDPRTGKKFAVQSATL